MATPIMETTPNLMREPETGGKQTQRQRIPNTCEWISREPAYNAWKSWDDASPPALWIHGPPGCGKSYLAQYIVEDLKSTEGKSVVLSYFCDSSSSPASILRSLLEQLHFHASTEAQLREKITEILEQSSSNPLPLDVSYWLWDRFAAVMGDAPPITIVIDGLDELPPKYLLPQEFDFPARIAELPTVMTGYIRLLVISRTEISIRSALKEDQDIQITADKIRDDTEVFISSEISKHEILSIHRREIINMLLPQSEGIFQWAALAIKALAQEPTTERVLERLADLPVSLEDMYGNIFKHQLLDLHHGELLIRDRILRLMVFAVRPLNILEIGHILSAESGTVLPDLETKVIKVCGSLITIENGILKPVHHSLRDFLLSEHTAVYNIRGIDPKLGNLFMARTLLNYISHSKFSCISEPLDGDNFRSTHPLAEYATLYWVHHASLAESNYDLRDQIRNFFNTENAKEWADKLLVHFLRDSVLPIPPRPFDSARFFHLFTLKGQIINCFDSIEKPTIDEHITKYLCTMYEDFVRTEGAKYGPTGLSVLQRLLDLSYVFSWCPLYQKHVASTLLELIDSASELSSLDSRIILIAAYQALADEYKRSGFFKDAQQLLGQLLLLANLYSPENDPAIMFALDSLGWVCMRLDQLEEAVTHLEKALKLAIEYYGSQSPMTLRSRVTLAEVLSKLGRHAEAEALCAALKEQLRQHQTNSVPLPVDSISHLSTLAFVYMQAKDYSKAEELYKIVVEDRKRLFGEEHRLTMWAEIQWGLAVDKCGDMKMATEVFNRLIVTQSEVLGVNHPDVREMKERLRGSE